MFFFVRIVCISSPFNFICNELSTAALLTFQSARHKQHIGETHTRNAPAHKSIRKLNAIRAGQTRPHHPAKCVQRAYSRLSASLSRTLRIVCCVSFGFHFTNNGVVRLNVLAHFGHSQFHRIVGVSYENTNKNKKPKEKKERNKSKLHMK